MPLKWIVILIVGVAVLSAVLAVIFSSYRVRRKVNYMLDALEDGETNFRFSERKSRLNKTLNRLNGIFKQERLAIREQEKFFGTLLDNVKTGIVVFDTTSGAITYSNSRALQILGLASLVNIKQLRIIDNNLAAAFIAEKEVSDPEKNKASFYNESSQKTIVMSKSSALVQGRDVRIVSFNDVTEELETNQEEAYSKLIRVLTHEIMNTVTPISSLSDALVSYLEPEDDELTPERRKALRDGLDTIASSSRSLIQFVESYRNLTRVAPPVKSVFYVRDLASEVMELTSEQLASSGASLSFAERSDDVILFADRGQILQILINLVKNAVQAKARTINMEARIDSSDVTIIEVSNDGEPISPEAQKQMFVPFFTTKQEGTGIGLSLSRQIMRMHNGQIRLSSSTPEKTVFVLMFR
ncbi:MAG: GHKL domain-containing protein [Bacteroidales bacterium]|jgi:nitrogen fixation/metabolism regulation signal transduction histidine kinase|nr:GHKL domain-containing protein [Bacteroidales bacterium]